MREKPADTARAIVLALLVHLALALVLFAGLWWTRAAAPAAAAGAMSAEVVESSSLSSAMRRTIADRPEPIVAPEPEEVDSDPLPQPEPEPRPEDQPTPVQREAQDFIPQPDDVNQEAVVDAPTPTPAEEAKVQEAKRRQEQVDLTEQQRQQDAERQRRLSEMEQQRQQQLAEIRRRRALAARDAKVAEAQLRQIAEARAASASEEAARSDAAASQPAGAGGTDTGLQARYAEALRQAIVSKWTRPETVPIGAPCRLVIRQLPGGEVMDVQVASPCSYDEQGQESIKRAVLKAQPLPYAGFEPVFQRTLTLNFKAADR
ncbi:TonB C-terminal domain-containing protein [Cognatilysobacter tabacisoli]|uniref:TonB C-terminal domain-containing protein n=1 Tax=Cognatilysobacter tabacisoli TaxID=2315424 RepID=UPI000E6B0DCC|nr:TonB C-terminal domain-containing protein [Lysobacter tabacisoli]